MPAEKGIRLNNEERLFPTAGSPCEQHQKYLIRPGTHWALHLTAQNDELLTKQGVFCDEVRLGAGQIGERCTHERVPRWPRPLQQALAEPMKTGTDLTLEGKKPDTHNDLARW